MGQRLGSWWLDVQGRFDECMMPLDDDVVGDQALTFDQ